MAEWRAIPSLCGKYEASDLGEIRRAGTSKGCRAGRVLRTSKNNRGYRLVYPCVDGVPLTRTVHRLVAEAFLGPCPSDREINHRDGNKANNASTNLEYVTRSENMKHAHATGLKKGGQPPEFVARGERVAHAKLTTAKVLAIRARSHEPRSALAVEFGVSRSQIDRVCAGATWAHITTTSGMSSDASSPEVSPATTATPGVSPAPVS